jgi:hypothetical protein
MRRPRIYKRSLYTRRWTCRASKKRHQQLVTTRTLWQSILGLGARKRELVSRGANASGIEGTEEDAITFGEAGTVVVMLPVGMEEGITLEAQDEAQEHQVKLAEGRC